MMIFRNYSGHVICRMPDCKNVEWTMRRINADTVECYDEMGNFTGCYMCDGEDIGFFQATFND